MLDHFTIFTKGGIVLWSNNETKLKGNPVDNLVRSVLLEERGGQNYSTSDNYSMKWTFANEFDLLFVVVYQKILSLLYLEELLEHVKRKFCERFNEMLSAQKNLAKYDFDFTDMFNKILASIETKTNKEKEDRLQKGPRKFGETEKAKKIQKEGGKKTEDKENETKDNKIPEEVSPKPERHSTSNGVEPESLDSDEQKIRENIEKTQS